MAPLHPFKIMSLLKLLNILRHKPNETQPNKIKKKIFLSQTESDFFSLFTTEQSVLTEITERKKYFLW